MNKYQVIVGNIGTVYEGDNCMEALINFDHYENLSSCHVGRCSDEPVTLFESGEPVKANHHDKRV